MNSVTAVGHASYLCRCALIVFYTHLMCIVFCSVATHGMSPMRRGLGSKADMTSVLYYTIKIQMLNTNTQHKYKHNLSNTSTCTTTNFEAPVAVHSEISLEGWEQVS